ncbi:hypothetical protein SCP_0509530 [Sparassis crispa]|uniref:DUF6699 domain-containing protein n=1 Tax=Sparassis crispa TaxID=139825 RepID=A0A401GNV9_9APHY|nr:hypothetical protein SCP_0509530 [Sparassis crispa]GBE83896.1 hypothetical protein SCP_0509530 [Sparassis crispa]
MADYSDMPGLVDNPMPAGYPGATPYHQGFGRTVTSSASGTPWTSARQDGGAAWGETNSPWGGYESTEQQLWPAPSPQHQQASPWPAPAPSFVSATPAGYVPASNPAMPTTMDSWGRPIGEMVQNERYNDERYTDELPWKNGSELSALRRSLSRTHSAFSSNTPSPASSSPLSRSRSVRSVLDRRTLPPPEWRPEFSMTRSGLSQALGSLFTKRRSSSISLPFTSDVRWPKLHPYLRYNATSPPMCLDIRQVPLTMQFRDVRRQVNAWDLTRFACEPPVARMRLYNAHLPWFIDVESTNPVGVTLHELFNAIWQSMMTPITTMDWFNCEMDDGARGRIADAWASRCTSQEDRKMGVRRVDFLLDRVVLEGFAKGREGMWEMKLNRLL